MHYLQKAILDKLRYGQPLRYSDLMPEGIESSHFRYHLKQLTADGLVEKNDDQAYHLTDKGLREIDYLSANRTRPVRIPKVITYTLLTHSGQTLLYKKPKEPYRNLWGLIGGKIHFGEDAQYAAQREVYEKTGLSIGLPDFCGIADIIINKHGEPLSHAIAFVHKVDISDLPPHLPTELKPIDITKLDEHHLIPDLKLLLQAINDCGYPFVHQIRAELPA
ncbi:MAG TPA: NUDIX domain-containing protein [Candidatus Saccharimonadales bacterium]|nr:NUDIX domain-containing protein [Candidatus Saccharimonadales bacterium]